GDTVASPLEALSLPQRCTPTRSPTLAIGCLLIPRQEVVQAGEANQGVKARGRLVQVYLLLKLCGECRLEDRSTHDHAFWIETPEIKTCGAIQVGCRPRTKATRRDQRDKVRSPLLGGGQENICDLEGKVDRDTVPDDRCLVHRF